MTRLIIFLLTLNIAFSQQDSSDFEGFFVSSRFGSSNFGREGSLFARSDLTWLFKNFSYSLSTTFISEFRIFSQDQSKFNIDCRIGYISGFEKLNIDLGIGIGYSFMELRDRFVEYDRGLFGGNGYSYKEVRSLNVPISCKLRYLPTRYIGFCAELGANLSSKPDVYWSIGLEIGLLRKRKPS